ncbi:MAG: hypothetical protein IJ496_02215 [Ruminococcus sp.]|nr:hypothetical protein [Ruminococcus sp.]
MRKWMYILTALSLLSFCGCSRDKQDPEMEDISHEQLVMHTDGSAVSEESVQTVTNTETVPSSSETETAAGTDSVSAPVQTVISYIETVQGQQTETAAVTDAPEMEVTALEITTAAATAPVLYPEETGPAEGIYGAQGRTEEEWLVLGQEMYQQAMELSFRFLCTGSEFPFDMDNLEIIDRTYFRTTCISYEEATAPYYELFSRMHHENDFDGLLMEQDGVLYAARAARGMDISYISSEVTELVSVSESEVVFNVHTEYEESEITGTFTLVPEDGFWKVGVFTLPY